MITYSEDRIIQCRTRKRWRQAREDGLYGASESASVLGCGWKSKFELWHQKAGNLPMDDLSDNEAVFWGKHLEGPIVRAYRDRYDRSVQVWPQTRMIRHATLPWMTCTPDAFQLDEEKGVGILEVKNVGLRMAERWIEDEPPLEYHIQLQHQLAVTGCDWGSVVALIGGQRLVVKDCQRDDAFITQLEGRLAEFRQSVLDGVEPDPDGSENTRTVLQTLHPEDDGSDVVLPLEFDALDDELIQLEAEKKDRQRRIDEIKNQIRHAIGDHKIGRLPSGAKWTWSLRDVPEKVVKGYSFRALTRSKAK